jgi:hypothetical protein
MYFGIDHIFEVKGNKSKKKLSLITKNNYLSSFVFNDNPSKYIVRCTKQGSDTLIVKLGSKVLLTKHYEVQKLNNPICNLGDIKSNEAKRSEIVENEKLKFYYPNCTLKNRLRINSFVLYRITKSKDTILIYDTTSVVLKDTIVRVNIETGEEEYEYIEEIGYIKTNIGDLLTPFQRREILKMEKDEKLLFSNIKVSSADCAIRRIDDYVITIKE